MIKDHQGVADYQKIQDNQHNQNRKKNFISRMRAKVRKNRNDFCSIEEIEEGDIERVTSGVIAEVAGTGGLLEQKLEDCLAGLKKSGYPLGKKEAEAILMALLEMAAGYHTVLSERIAQSVTRQEGVILHDYRQRMEKINILAADTYVALDRMQKARENAIYQRDISNAVTEMVHSIPSLNLNSDARKDKAEAAKGEVGDKIKDEIKG